MLSQELEREWEVLAELRSCEVAEQQVEEEGEPKVR